MYYYDYVWDLNPDMLILDAELDTKKLGWQPGDVFKLVEINGKKMIKKVDPLHAFLEGKQVNE